MIYNLQKTVYMYMIEVENKALALIIGKAHLCYIVLGA